MSLYELSPFRGFLELTPIPHAAFLWFVSCRREQEMNIKNQHGQKMNNITNQCFFASTNACICEPKRSVGKFHTDSEKTVPINSQINYNLSTKRQKKAQQAVLSAQGYHKIDISLKTSKLCRNKLTDADRYSYRDYHYTPSCQFCKYPFCTIFCRFFRAKR